MLHTTQGIKLSDKEYHELHYVVMNDTRFKAFGLTNPAILKLAHMLEDADMDVKKLKVEDLENYEIVKKELDKE